jgi:hypothetical protein
MGSHEARTRDQIQVGNKTRKVNDELLMASEIVKHQKNAQPITNVPDPSIAERNDQRLGVSGETHVSLKLLIM